MLQEVRFTLISLINHYPLQSIVILSRFRHSELNIDASSLLKENPHCTLRSIVPKYTLQTVFMDH